MPHFYYFILYFTSSKLNELIIRRFTIPWYKYGNFMKGISDTMQ